MREVVLVRKRNQDKEEGSFRNICHDSSSLLGLYRRRKAKGAKAKEPPIEDNLDHEIESFAILIVALKEVPT